MPDEARQIAGVGRALHDDETVDWPVYGLRHPPENKTSGWYLWNGDLLQDADFFVPVHPAHLAGKVPGLPPALRPRSELPDELHQVVTGMPVPDEPRTAAPTHTPACST